MKKISIMLQCDNNYTCEIIRLMLQLEFTNYVFLFIIFLDVKIKAQILWWEVSI
jgi:hypothetical protein